MDGGGYKWENAGVTNDGTLGISKVDGSNNGNGDRRHFSAITPRLSSH